MQTLRFVRSFGEAFGHFRERLRQLRDLVVPRQSQSLRQIAFGHRLGHVAQLPDRLDDGARQDVADGHHRERAQREQAEQGVANLVDLLLQACGAQPGAEDANGLVAHIQGREQESVRHACQIHVAITRRRRVRQDRVDLG